MYTIIHIKILIHMSFTNRDMKRTLIFFHYQTSRDFSSSTCGDTFIHACGKLVSANTAVLRYIDMTYHDQREQISAKVGPGRSLVHFLWRLKLGCLGRTFDCLLAGGTSRYRTPSEQS